MATGDHLTSVQLENHIKDYRDNNAMKKVWVLNITTKDNMPIYEAYGDERAAKIAFHNAVKKYDERTIKPKSISRHGKDSFVFYAEKDDTETEAMVYLAKRPIH